MHLISHGGYTGLHDPEPLMSATPTTASKALADLYESDETAWLEAMAQLVAQRRTSELDYEHLGEYLCDMACRDRREVTGRLVNLLSHLLKWDFQPDRQTGSWRASILEQRRELRVLLESGTLRDHSEVVLDSAYQDACEQARVETGFPAETFPGTCPFSIDELLAG